MSGIRSLTTYTEIRIVNVSEVDDSRVMQRTYYEGEGKAWRAWPRCGQFAKDKQEC
jgi:hypothetical protein